MSWHWHCKEHGNGEKRSATAYGEMECPICALARAEKVLEAARELSQAWELSGPGVVGPRIEARQAVILAICAYDEEP